jgi:beta-glucanase (GH16 family)
VHDDFEGNGTISSWYADDCGMDLSFGNIYSQGLNISSLVMRYDDYGGQYANVNFDIGENLNLSVNHTFSLKIYIESSSLTGAQNNQISLKLQDGTIVSPWETQCEIIKNVALNQWQEVTFNFENDPYINFNPGSGDPILRTDFNRVLLQVNGENNNDLVVAFIDDVQYDGTIGLCSVFNNLVWSDEFDGNGPVDASKWFHQTLLPNGWGWFNGELQHYTDREDNSYVDDGFLHIVAKDETFTDQGVTKEYTSARLNSKFAFTYGRIETRAKMPFGIGTWPAIWMLGKNINEAGAYWQTQGFGTTAWPACGEIDILEHWGSNQNYVQSALHTPSSSGATINHGGTMAADVSNTFHIYAMEWTEDKIDFSVDGIVYYTYQPDPQNMNTWPFVSDQFILLNVAIENSINPAFTESDMVLDYIRVYQEGLGSTTTYVQEACDSYTWVDGVTYSESNNSASITLPNAEGCDSTIVLDLTINNSYSQADVQSSCDSYTWIDDVTYTESNSSATQLFTTSAGCDSTITLALTLNSSTSSEFFETALDPYTLNETTYNSSGVYTQIITNQAGCDSTITLNLTIDSSVGMDEQNQSFFVFPNPTNDKLNITAPELIGKRAKVIHISGKLAFEFVQASAQIELDCNELAPGEYIISFEGGNNGARLSFIKN